MEFKCKNCGKDKYRQINFSVKQCLFCGKMILSEGNKAEDLDWTNEIVENENKSYARFKFDNKASYNMSYKELLKAMENLMDLPMDLPFVRARNIANE